MAPRFDNLPQYMRALKMPPFMFGRGRGPQGRSRIVQPSPHVPSAFEVSAITLVLPVRMKLTTSSCLFAPTR
jgi:hypothetical protein